VKTGAQAGAFLWENMQKTNSEKTEKEKTLFSNPTESYQLCHILFRGG